VDAFAMGESETGSAGVGGEETDVDDDAANMASEDNHDNETVKETVKGNLASLVRTLVNAEAETLVWQGQMTTEHSWEVIWLEKDGIVHASLL
jgi:hypothetical protein